MAKRILSEEEATEINLSPMIDCIFILLIFFIVTTVFIEEQGVQVSKPDAAEPVDQEESDNLALEITSENKILIDRREISLAEVSEVVKGALKEPETPISIRAHEKSSHGTFVQVWDAAKRGGAVALSFSTTH